MSSDNNSFESENKEWIDSLKWVIENDSEDRARQLISLMVEETNLDLATDQIITDYVNTIQPEQDAPYPGDRKLEQNILNALRWNAMAMVVKANKKYDGLGGHISTYASASTLLEVGFNHFFRGYDEDSPDLIYFQGHASPGIYARSFLEYRLDEENLDSFRREIQTDTGLSSYPHPKLMPGYWRYPTVSMGLSPLQAIYQARFIKYLENRKVIEWRNQKVWAFLGDGEMDEPESTGSLAVASRNKLNNLIFVINCNLQRLDGPVSGNYKIVNELEGLFKGAGWTVIKVLWGETWQKLLEKDNRGVLIEKLNEIPDGQLQKWAQLDGKSMRQDFFNKNAYLKQLADDFDDEELNDLTRGGHDPKKVYNAYLKAVNNQEGPTVILAQTVKGYRQEDAGEASNVTHQQKKFNSDQLKNFRDELNIPLKDESLDDIPYYRFDKGSAEYKYLAGQRKALGGWLPERKSLCESFSMPDKKIFQNYYDGSDGKKVTTTSVVVKILSDLIADENTGHCTIPIVPDESRTLGIDSLFGKVGVYEPEGQIYDPVDEGNLLRYKEMKDGVILEEGITEAGSMASFIAAGTSQYSIGLQCIPFFVFYSMFGFQRIGDMIWAAADAGARGFMIGGISGRTSLSGEGLQHTDGQSHLYALAYPNLQAYHPAFACEIALIIQAGMKRMYAEGEEIFYYITVTNQKYEMPPLSAKNESNILKGIYLFKESDKNGESKEKLLNLMGSGAIMQEVLEAAEILETDYDIPVNIWSVTSYKALYDDAVEKEKKNLTEGKKTENHITEQLSNHGDFFIAASDYIRALPLSIAKWIPGTYQVLGTDGFGPSDTVDALRAYFQLDAKHIVYTALLGLKSAGKLNDAVLNDFKENHDGVPFSNQKNK